VTQFVSLHCTASGKIFYFSFGSFNFLLPVLIHVQIPLLIYPTDVTLQILNESTSMITLRENNKHPPPPHFFVSSQNNITNISFPKTIYIKELKQKVPIHTEVQHKTTKYKPQVGLHTEANTLSFCTHRQSVPMSPCESPTEETQHKRVPTDYLYVPTNAPGTSLYSLSGPCLS